MFFSKNILFYNIVIFFVSLFYSSYCSIDCKYEYFCTTENRNSKRVFLKSILFELADGISHVLVDRLTWNLEEIFTGCTFTTDFKIWCVFRFYFLTTQKTKSTRKIDILTSECCHFFNFRNFAVSVVRATAIFILIKMYFGLF